MAARLSDGAKRCRRSEGRLARPPARLLPWPHELLDLTAICWAPTAFFRCPASFATDTTPCPLLSRRCRHLALSPSTTSTRPSPTDGPSEAAFRRRLNAASPPRRMPQSLHSGKTISTARLHHGTSQQKLSQGRKMWGLTLGHTVARMTRGLSGRCTSNHVRSFFWQHSC